MTFTDVVMYHINQCLEAIACNEPDQADMHRQMAKVLLDDWVKNDPYANQMCSSFARIVERSNCKSYR